MRVSDTKVTVVIGLGKTGLSCIRYLLKKGEDVIAIDTRNNPPSASALNNIPVYTGGWHPDILFQASTIVLSPGLSLKEPCLIEARQRGIPIIGDIELFARVAKAPIVAITGSNAKTTVTNLVGEMALVAGVDVRVGGNIGAPVLDLLEDTEPELYLLELSSFQLETTYSLQPAVATILNITPDHLDRYDSFDEYKAAKQRIYHEAKIKIYNQGDEHTYPDSDIKRDDFLFFSEECLPILKKHLKIKGQHNVLNAAAAWAIGSA
ncbi:MAG: UDP-N-acetylmuramoyl-L-alanine--D-glutamate ligase, partial [Gammaproteobacteria bacterium]